MTNRFLVPLVLALLACVSAQAAPKKKHAPPPAKDAATQDVSPQEIDVDAMARAKDGKPTEPLVAPAAAQAPTAVGEAAHAEAAAPAAGESAPADSATPAAVEAAPVDAAAPAADEAAPAAATDTAAPAPAPADAAPAPAPEATPNAAEDVAPATRPSPLAPPPAPNALEKSLAAACEARATALLDAAQKADYASATRDFDARMRTALPPPKFQQAWESLAQFGHLQARGQSHPMKGDGYIAITIPLVFDKANLYAQIACGSDGRIAGFYVKPL